MHITDVDARALISPGGEVAGITAPLNESGRRVVEGMSSELNEATKRAAQAGLCEIVGTRGVTTPGYRPFPHPFPARMPLEVAKAAIAKFSGPGQTVLDPMCGSGVIAKAAVLQGRRAVARDLDPLAIYLSRALCSWVPAVEFMTAAGEILDRAKAIANRRDYLAKRLANLPDEDRAFVKYWFSNQAASQLFALAEALDEFPATPSLLFAVVNFSSCIIARCDGASRAMDISRSRPHRVLTRMPKPPFDLWARNAANVSKYLNTTRGVESEADIRRGDARRLDLRDESVDAVATSPPYVNAVDYIRTSKFTLVFFGHTLANLRAVRSVSVGTERGLTAGKLPPSLDSLVEASVADGQRRPILRRYVQDMHSVLSETNRVLRKGGRAVFVVGPSILSRREYDGAVVLGQIARHAGLEVLGDARRDLNASSRSLPPPNRNQRQASMHKRMTCELYVALRKPV